MEIKEGQYVVGMWFCAGKNRDWLGNAWREGDEWMIEWRFRYYSEDSVSPFDSKDEKNFYNMAIKVTEENTEERIESVLSGMLSMLVAGGFGNKQYYVPIKSDDPKTMIEKLRSMPFAHIAEFNEKGLPS